LGHGDEAEKKKAGGACRIEAAAFVVDVKSGPRGGHTTTGDDPMAQYLISVLTDTTGLATAEEMAGAAR
jgi:hypothetical protein